MQYLMTFALLVLATPVLAHMPDPDHNPCIGHGDTPMLPPCDDERSEWEPELQ